MDSAMLVLFTLGLACFGTLAQSSQPIPFWTAVKAHSSPDVCPPAPGGTWSPDNENFICCYTVTTNFPTFVAPETATPTTLSSKSVVGCCPTGYTCTGNPPPILDWASGTAFGQVNFNYWTEPTAGSSPTATTTSTIPTPIAATAGAATTTGPDLSTSIGTISGPGATPYTTFINGSVLYETVCSLGGNGNGNSGSNNNNGNGNVQACGSVRSGGGPLSKPDIAAIAIGVLGLLLSAIGIWYAHKNFIVDGSKIKRREHADKDKLGPPTTSV